MNQEHSPQSKGMIALVALALAFLSGTLFLVGSFALLFFGYKNGLPLVQDQTLLNIALTTLLSGASIFIVLMPLLRLIELKKESEQEISVALPVTLLFVGVPLSGVFFGELSLFDRLSPSLQPVVVTTCLLLYSILLPVNIFSYTQRLSTCFGVYALLIFIHILAFFIPLSSTSVSSPLHIAWLDLMVSFDNPLEPCWKTGMGKPCMAEEALKSSFIIECKSIPDKELQRECSLWLGATGRIAECAALTPSETSEGDLCETFAELGKTAPIGCISPTLSVAERILCIQTRQREHPDPALCLAEGTLSEQSECLIHAAVGAQSLGLCAALESVSQQARCQRSVLSGEVQGGDNPDEGPQIEGRLLILSKILRCTTLQLNEACEQGKELAQKQGNRELLELFQKLTSRHSLRES